MVRSCVVPRIVLLSVIKLIYCAEYWSTFASAAFIGTLYDAYRAAVTMWSTCIIHCLALRYIILFCTCFLEATVPSLSVYTGQHILRVVFRARHWIPQVHHLFLSPLQSLTCDTYLARLSKFFTCQFAQFSLCRPLLRICIR